ncbi:unnamed protein product, partial [Gulo gulo]
TSVYINPADYRRNKQAGLLVPAATTPSCWPRKLTTDVQIGVSWRKAQLPQPPGSLPLSPLREGLPLLPWNTWPWPRLSRLVSPWLTGTFHASLELYVPQRADLGCYRTFSSWEK